MAHRSTQAAEGKTEEKALGSVIRIDEAEFRNHLGEMVRQSVEETLNGMLEAEADRLCQAGGMSGRRTGRTRGPATIAASCRRRPGR